MYLLIPTTKFKKELKKYRVDREDIRSVLKILEAKRPDGDSDKENLMIS